MFKTLVSIVPRRRLTTVAWLVIVVVLLQLLFSSIVDEVRSKDAQVSKQDCSTTKNSVPKISSEKLTNPAFLRSNRGLFLHVGNTPAVRTTDTERGTEEGGANYTIKDAQPTPNEDTRNFEKTTGVAKSNEESQTSDASYTGGELSDGEEVTGVNCKQFRNRTSVNGHLNLHEWRGWCGFAVDDLRREPLFPFKPQVNTVLEKFATNVTKRSMSGKRIFGYVHPPITGDFVFAISSADGSELWLSSNDDPKNSKKIAYLGEPGNQYGASTHFGNFQVKASQASEAIRLEVGKAYYVEVLQKQKYGQDHVEVAWKMPGDESLEVIGSQYISQYIDYSAEKAEINARLLCICKGHPTLLFAYDEFMTREQYDLRDDFHSRVEDLPHSEVSDVLPLCPYQPSYVVSKKLNENEAFTGNFIQHPRVFPNDRTDVNMSHDVKNHISWGNKKLEKNDALKIVSSYMEALAKKKGDRFVLKEIVNVEAKDDPKKGTRYLLELELLDKYKEHSVRLSEYVYKPVKNNTDLCDPDGFQWKRNVTVSMVITVKNYGPWIKFLINQLTQIYEKGYDSNFFLVIVDFNSSDIDLFQLRENSGIKDRVAILRHFTEFHKTRALNDGVRYIKDPNSIIFTADLHIKFPVNIFDVVRKHAIQGRSFYSPAVLKLKCGYSITHQQAYWEMMGYGLFGAYKSDWDSFGGMDEVKFTTRWGGEDWDLMDRAIGANLEAERLRLPKLYHYHHERKSDWYEFARM
ncbi:beta-1,4-N-acetylgalactosaminyltransferase 3 [Pocillopora verrucosa]|uniref:beta-1,4-N-acetylgalactosaminyltransferase 3 n=1 Tax=Pocillopora verrucosa TaxID=203993 RepID=UPI00333F6A28